MKASSKLVTILGVAVLVSGAMAASAQQAGRVAGTVVDQDGAPIEGVKITVSAQGMDMEIVKTTNKKGKFTVAHSDAAMTYQYKFEKQGFQTLVLPINPPVGGTELREFTLLPVGGGPPPSDAEPSSGPAPGGGGAVRTYNEGVEAQRLGDFETAAEKYRAAVEADPDLAVAHTSLAAVLLKQEQYEAAAAEAEAALAVDASDVRAMQIRFDAYRLAGDEEQSKKAAQALREVGNLGDAAARIFNEGVDAFNARDLTTAQSKFQQVVQLDPEMVQPYLALAQISLTQGSGAEAAAMAQSALELEPDNTRALRLAFDGCRLAGDTECAKQAMEKLVVLEPDWVSTVLFQHATDLFNSNQAAEAAFELEYVVKADPDLARAHYLLGMALYNSGRADEGRPHLERFIELAPEDPDVEIAKGLLSYQP